MKLCKGCKEKADTALKEFEIVDEEYKKGERKAWANYTKGIKLIDKAYAKKRAPIDKAYEKARKPLLRAWRNWSIGKLYKRRKQAQPNYVQFH